MAIRVNDNSVTISVTIPKPFRGGGVALFKTIKGERCVLLGLRKNAPFANYWSFPGGGAHRFETLASAALREFKEETGVYLKPNMFKKKGFVKTLIPFFKWTTLVFETRQLIAPRKQFYSYEFYKVQWVPVKKLKQYNLHPLVMKVVNRFEKDEFEPITSSVIEKLVKPFYVRKELYSSVPHKRVATRRKVV